MVMIRSNYSDLWSLSDEPKCFKLWNGCKFQGMWQYFLFWNTVLKIKNATTKITTHKTKTNEYHTLSNFCSYTSKPSAVHNWNHYINVLKMILSLRQSTLRQRASLPALPSQVKDNPRFFMRRNIRINFTVLTSNSSCPPPTLWRAGQNMSNKMIFTGTEN